MTDTAPTRIWLNDGGDFSAASGHEDGVTWCVHRVDDGDSEYILASEHATLIQEAEARGMERAAELALSCGIAVNANQRDAIAAAIRAAKATP